MSWSWKKKGATERTSSLDNGGEKESRMAEDAAARDERIKELNSRLARALADAAAAKQHAKVAEEAVSGWERAGAEAEASKQQLAEVLKEKAALQDKVAHLDGALKDCTRQVRLVREEQEQKRQELLQKKSKDMERLRVEYEARLADLGRQLLEASAENKVMAMTVQEHLQTVRELNDDKSRVEAENRMFQQHIQAMEKDKAALKYEVHLLNKEIHIRNEERQYCKRDMDAANKQHIEDTKKINRLEAECQKLRTLVRRKLPGPNTVAQMKMEADRNPEVQLLVERLLSMEEETKVLKETLSQRNDELNKAESKLTAMEAYFSSAAAAEKAKKDDREEVNCADAWASALVAELSQFKKEKLISPPTANGLHSPVPTSIMDDFAEMERLASSEPDTPLSLQAQKKEDGGSPTDTAARKKLDPLFAVVQEADSTTTVFSLVDKAIMLVEELAKAAGLEPEKQTSDSIQRLRVSAPPESAEQVLELIKQILSALNSLMSAAFPDSRVECDTQTTEESAGPADDKLLELEMLRIEKNALEAHLKTELTKMTSMDKELTNLRSQKETLQAAIQSGHTQLEEAQKLIEELKARVEDNKEEAMVIREVETQAQSVNGVQDVVSKLEKELEEEEDENNKEVATEQEQAKGEDSKFRKEQEIQEAGQKLAECQRTILALGEQLKALSSSGADAMSSVSSALSLARLHSDAESAAEQNNNRALVVYSPPKSPDKNFNNGKMFEELGLHSPLDLSPLGSPLTTKRFKHRSSLTRFFSRGKATP